MALLKDKRIVLGITGSIAAYKSVDLIRRLKDEGAYVSAVLTRSAERFLPAITIEAACSVKVYSDLYDPPMTHIQVPEEADLFVIAPATANIIGKYASAIADDLLSTMLLAYQGKALIAPAMNWRMYGHPGVQENIRRLSSQGVTFIEPETGSLACGETGKGRLADTDNIIAAIKKALVPQDMKGERVLVTAGPTREHIDPVRFISNRSSGKMGYALAESAFRRGAEVTLVSGPVCLKPPYGVRVVNIEGAEDMYDAVMSLIKDTSILIMAAAVADFAPLCTEGRKIEKGEELTLKLKKTMDILSSVSALDNRPFILGFAAQTGADETERARTKLIQKGIDMIVFNDVLAPDAGFDKDTNKVTVLSAYKERDRDFPCMTKKELADCLLDCIHEYRGN